MNINETFIISPTDGAIFITGGTFNNETLVLSNSDNSDIIITGFTGDFTGGTVTGGTIFTNGITANTYNGDGSNLILSKNQLINTIGNQIYYPYSTNPNGYISGITSNNVTTALGYIPYNSNNPSGFTTQNNLNNYQLLSEKNLPNGYAGLDINGILPTNLFPDSILGNVKFKGTYNGSLIISSDSIINNQPLPTASTGNTGWYFISTSAYTANTISYEVGDWILGIGTSWGKVDNSDAITSFNGRIGNIVLNSNDVTTALDYRPLNNNGDSITGTSGNGFLGLVNQNTNPLIPSSGIKIFANNINDFSWIGTDGYVRTFDDTSNTGDRTYSLPNRNGTILLSGDVVSSQWVNNGTSISYNAGNIGVGTDTPDQRITVVSDNTTSTFINTVYETTQNYFPPAFIGRKARGTQASPTAVQSGDYLFQLGGRGYNGTTFSISSSGAIIIGANGNFTTASTPTYASIELTPSGSTTRNEVVKFTNGGMQFVPTGSVNLNHIGTTSRLNFGMMSGSASTSSEINGAYFSVFGNNWSNATQKGSAEFVFDTRNADSTALGFGITSYDGTNWTRFLRIATPTGRAIFTPDSSKLTFNSGIFPAFTIAPSITTSGSAGYRGLYLSVFEQSVSGSGSSILADFGLNTQAGGAGAHTSRMVVLSNGNVGIGTTNPLAANTARRALVVSDTTNNTTIRQEGASSVVTEWTTVAGSSNIGVRSIDSFGIFTSALTRLWIDPTGNVGIGTTNPAALLHTFGSMAVPIVAERNTTANTTMQFKNPGFSVWTGMDGAGNFGVSRTSADLGNFSDMLRIDRASGKLNVRTGANTSTGTATLTGGTVTVSNTSVTANSIILLTNININTSTAIGTLTQGTITAGTSFVVNSRRQSSPSTIEVSDQSTFTYLIIN
jgi:hypothetical protein